MTQHKPTSRSNAFTLVELLVVIAIFSIVAIAAVPSVSTIIDQMSAHQAYEVMSAQIGAAQALAPARGKYTAVHVQQADGASTVRDLLDIEQTTSYVAIFQLEPVGPGSPNTAWPGTSNPDTPAEPAVDEDWMRFQLAPGYEMRRMPASMAFGQVDAEFVTNGGAFTNVAGNLEDFTSFSIVFDPNGTLVTTVDAGRNPQFDAEGEMFVSPDNLWDINTTDDAALPGEPGVRAFTMFRFGDLPASNPEDWLDDNAAFYPITSYTGEVFPRE